MTVICYCNLVVRQDHFKIEKGIQTLKKYISDYILLL